MIEFDAVSKCFGTGASRVQALRSITLRIPTGQMCALMGPSGAGKSTLMHAATGLTPVDSGRILVDGRDITALNSEGLALMRRREVGVILQAVNLVPFFTAYENVALPLRLNGLSKQAEQQQVVEALRLVGLEDRAQHKPHQLSGGEAQRVATARALVFSPRVIFADEPTGSLDSVAGRQIMTLLREVNLATRVTMVIVTHDPVWASLCHRVVRIVDGRITEDLDLPEDQEGREVDRGDLR
jgi:putative ABC transport system ATP-binding protein